MTHFIKSIIPNKPEHSSTKKTANSPMEREMLKRIRVLGKRIKQARINSLRPLPLP